RVPAVGLVAEVCAGLDQFLHRDGLCRHSHFLSGYASGKLEPCGKVRCGTGMSVLSMWICSSAGRQESQPWHCCERALSCV
ncbi:MAG: hypothetical protein KDE55_09230, partial [Novosphingobium sp.]|nr:hypothetical protein [Novosphingobium sp.]